jgi:hypothetical protein
VDRTRPATARLAKGTISRRKRERPVTPQVHRRFIVYETTAPTANPTRLESSAGDRATPKHRASAIWPAATDVPEAIT